MKKYLIIGDWITSQTDGDWHYISAENLIRLYGVDPAECIIYSDKKRELGLDPNLDLIVLRPRYDGNYRLPD